MHSCFTWVVKTYGLSNTLRCRSLKNSMDLLILKNSPLFIKCFDTNSELTFNYFIHSSIDMLEERLAFPTKYPDCYLGELISFEDINMYYCGSH